jgi:hypothetical protein
MGGSMPTVGKPRAENAFAQTVGKKPGWQSMRPAGNAFADYNQRFDGTQKGQGYLGPLTNSQGQTMTEYSIGVNIDGRDMEIPTIVPTLDENEIQYLLNMRDDMPLPPSIQRKAIDHAIERQRQGLSPFADTPWNPMKGRR